MLASRIRFIAAIFEGALGLASCGGGAGTSPIAPPGESMPSAAQTEIAAAYCKTLGFIDFKILPVRVRSPENSILYGCGIRSGARAIGSSAGHRSGTTRSDASSLTVFNVPGSISASKCKSYELFNDCGTLGFAINEWGTIAGPYLDSNAVITGYLRTGGGTYTSFDAPGAGLGPYLEQGTVPYEITNRGVIAGAYEDAQYVFHGFVRYGDGSFLTYEAPWASQIPNATVGQGTFTSTIDSNGDTAGFYYDAQGLNHGFIRDSGGSFVQVIPNGSVESSVCQGDCLNNSGTAAGNYTGSGGVARGFVRSAAGSITTIAKPGAVSTTLNGINNGNRVVGDYVDSKNVTWSFILGANKKRTVFQDPMASATSGNGTAALAINDEGAVTGIYADAKGIIHGFSRSQTGRFSEFDPQGSAETIPFDINAGGTVTGYWYDALGQVHGLIWRPR